MNNITNCRVQINFHFARRVLLRVFKAAASI
jgi:hypothetical protein